MSQRKIATTVKLFVGHDLLTEAFNLVEFATATDDLDSAVLVCIIQASSVVLAGYLLG